ncbi:metallophosphoesterase [Acetatifactor aquisgranensis]|uniref:metallophosphoesterase n=1 Tax=Acetatifactor aquisgranensis TaxID=2941233 RepID=UPI00203E150D|nr:metallophosphoesterase [Acetatifactor aquisgranensis]MCI8542418.1 metallophosphoesterase [Lachnospiraceae bacterium]
MWGFIFGGLAAGSVLGIIYLSSRFAKFRTVRKAAKGKKILRFLLGLILVLAVAFVTGAALGAINAAIVILHLMVIWLLCDGFSWIAEKKRGQKFRGYYAGILAIGITAVYLTCGWFLANHVWATHYNLETDKQVGGLRIVLFADSHVGNTFSGEGFGRWVEKMQAENPDIVVIAGDYVDDDTSKEDMAAACAALGTLKTTYGVYYAFGNHDKGYYGPAYRGYSGADLIAELEKNGVTVLQDETVLLGESFCLIGRQDRSEDQMGRHRATMEELTADLDPDRYSIVLDHQPHDYEAQAASGVDLVLSGHTHGGQLFPFHRMGEWLGLDDKSYGCERRGGTDFIVTSGISDWAIQFKTGCKSEYVVVDVQGAGQ